MVNADLHIHSGYSPDGEFSVNDILKEAKQACLSIISITDHNLIKAIPDALHSHSVTGLRIIPGIEIDCNFDGTDLHLLGYNINWESDDFKNLEAQINSKALEFFHQMISNLKPMGLSIDASEVLALSEGRVPSPEFIGEYLLTTEKFSDNHVLDVYRSGGSRSDMPYLNFYLDFFAQGKPAYVPMDYMDYSDALSLVTRNGGIPVIAHPGHNFKGSEETAGKLLDLGAKGLEVFNNYHTDKQMEYFAGVAIKRNVLITCGSDFHGKNKPMIKLGQFYLPEHYEGYVNQSIEELLC